MQLLYAGLLVAALYLAWLTVPYVRTTVACFDQKIADYDEVEFMTRSRGWSQLARCTYRQQKIFDLEKCLVKAEQGRTLPVQIKAFVFQAIPLVRPGSGELQGIQDGHDEECADYPSTMFRPPDIE